MANFAHAAAQGLHAVATIWAIGVALSFVFFAIRYFRTAGSACALQQAD